MNSFSAEPKIAVNPKAKKKPFILMNDIEYISNKYNGQNYRIFINKGYSWDGATIPRFLWRVVGSQYNPEFLPGSMIHDFLCENKGLIEKKGAYVSTCIFKDILELYGVSSFKASVMFAAVYAFQKTRKGWK